MTGDLVSATSEATELAPFEAAVADLEAVDAGVQNAREMLPTRDAQEQSLWGTVMEKGSVLKVDWAEIADERPIAVPQRDEYRRIVTLKGEPRVVLYYPLAVTVVHSHRRRERSTVLVRHDRDARTTQVVDVLAGRLANGHLRKLRTPIRLTMGYAFPEFQGGNRLDLVPQHMTKAVARELRDVQAELALKANRHQVLPGDA